MAKRPDDPNKPPSSPLFTAEWEGDPSEEPGLPSGSRRSTVDPPTPILKPKKGDHFSEEVFTERTRGEKAKLSEKAQARADAKASKAAKEEAKKARATPPKADKKAKPKPTVESKFEKNERLRQEALEEGKRLKDIAWRESAFSPPPAPRQSFQTAEEVRQQQQARAKPKLARSPPPGGPVPTFQGPTTPASQGPSDPVPTLRGQETPVPTFQGPITPISSIPVAPLIDLSSPVRQNLASQFSNMAGGAQGGAGNTPLTQQELQDFEDKLRQDELDFISRKKAYEDDVQAQFAKQLADNLDKERVAAAADEKRKLQSHINNLNAEIHRQTAENDRLTTAANVAAAATGNVYPTYTGFTFSGVSGTTPMGVGNLNKNMTFNQAPSANTSSVFPASASNVAAPTVAAAPSTGSTTASTASAAASSAMPTVISQGLKAREKVYSKHVPEDEELMKSVIADNKRGLPKMPTGLPSVCTITVTQPAGGGAPVTNVATRDPLEELVTQQLNYIHKLATGDAADRRQVLDELAGHTPAKVQTMFAEHRALAQSAAKHASIISRNVDIKALHPVYEKPCPRLGYAEAGGKIRRDFISALGSQMFSGDDDERDEKRKCPIRHLFEQAFNVIEENNLNRNGAFSVMRAALVGKALVFLNAQYNGGFTFESYWSTMQSMFGRIIDPSKLIHMIDRVRNTAPVKGGLAGCIAELTDLQEQNHYQLDGVEKAKAISTAVHRDIMYMVRTFYPYAYPEVERIEKDALTRWMAERQSLEDQGMPLTNITSTYHPHCTLTTIAVNACRELPVLGGSTGKKQYPVHAVGHDQSDSASNDSRSSKNSKRDRSSKPKSTSIAAASTENAPISEVVAAVLAQQTGQGGYNANRNSAPARQQQQQQRGPRQDQRGAQPARGGGNQGRSGFPNTRPNGFRPAGQGFSGIRPQNQGPRGQGQQGQQRPRGPTGQFRPTGGNAQPMGQKQGKLIASGALCFLCVKPSHEWRTCYMYKLPPGPNVCKICTGKHQEPCAAKRGPQQQSGGRAGQARP